MALRKVYRFHQLGKKAKEVAATEVYEREVEKQHDWTFECEMITEDIQEKLREEKLSFGEIYWDTNYGVHLDLSSVKMTDEYLEDKLSPEDYELYLKLKELSSEYLSHKLYDKDYGNREYEMVFTYASFGFNEEEGMEYIMKYSEDEEIKAKYKFPLLMESELSSEEVEELTQLLEEMGDEHARYLGEVIHPFTSELYDSLKKSIESRFEYLHSKQYYFDELNESDWLSDKYLFNLQGNVILESGKYVKNEYEEKYHDAV